MTYVGHFLAIVDKGRIIPEQSQELLNTFKAEYKQASQMCLKKKVGFSSAPGASSHLFSSVSLAGHAKYF